MTKSELFLAWRKAKQDWLDSIKNREKNSPHGGQWIQEMYRVVCEAEENYLKYIRDHADEATSDAEKAYLIAYSRKETDGEFKKWFEDKLREPY